MASTAVAVPVASASVGATMGTGAGTASVDKSVVGSGHSEAAGGFHQLLVKQGGKAVQSEVSKQSARQDGELSAILALLAKFGMVQLQPAQAPAASSSAGKQAQAVSLSASEGKLTVQGIQALLGMQGLSGLQMSQSQTAAGIPSEQGKNVPQAGAVLQEMTTLQQLLADSSAGGGSSGPDGSNLGAFEALIQQISKQDPSGQLSGQDVVAAIKSMLDVAKGDSPASAVQASQIASVYTALQQLKEQLSPGNSVNSTAGIANAGAAAKAIAIVPAQTTRETAAGVLQQSLTSASGQGSPVQLKQHVPAVRTQLSAWQHQVKMQPGTTATGTHPDPQQLTAGKENAAGITGAVQAPVGLTLAANQLTPAAVQQNLRIPAAELPQQIQSLLVKNASLQEQGGSRVFRITLMPEGLGEIKVVVAGDSAQNQISVQFLTDRAQTQDLLNSSLPALRSGLEALGVHLHKVEVDSFGSSSSLMGNTGNSGFLSQHSSSNPQGNSGGGQRQPAENLVETRAVRDEWTMMEEQAGTGSAAQINLTA